MKHRAINLRQIQRKFQQITPQNKYDFSKAYIKCQLIDTDTEMYICLDSGSESSVVTEGYLGMLGADFMKKEKSNMRLETFGDDVIQVGWKIKLNIQIEGNDEVFTITFQIDPNEKVSQCVFGQNMMRTLKLDMDFATWNEDRCEVLYTGEKLPNIGQITSMYGTNGLTIPNQYKLINYPVSMVENYRFSVPYAEIRTDGILRKYLVDTGAIVSTCEESVFTKKELKERMMISEIKKLYGANESEVPVLGKIKVRMALQSQESDEEYMIDHMLHITEGSGEVRSLGLSFFINNNLVHSNSLNCVAGEDREELNPYSYGRDRPIKLSKPIEAPVTYLINSASQDSNNLKEIELEMVNKPSILVDEMDRLMKREQDKMTVDGTDITRDSDIMEEKELEKTEFSNPSLDPCEVNMGPTGVDKKSISSIKSQKPSKPRKVTFEECPGSQEIGQSEKYDQEMGDLLDEADEGNYQQSYEISEVKSPNRYSKAISDTDLQSSGGDDHAIENGKYDYVPRKYPLEYHPEAEKALNMDQRENTDYPKSHPRKQIDNSNIMYPIWNLQYGMNSEKQNVVVNEENDHLVYKFIKPLTKKDNENIVTNPHQISGVQMCENKVQSSENVTENPPQISEVQMCGDKVQSFEISGKPKEVEETVRLKQISGIREGVEIKEDEEVDDSREGWWSDLLKLSKDTSLSTAQQQNFKHMMVFTSDLMQLHQIPVKTMHDVEWKQDRMIYTKYNIITQINEWLLGTASQDKSEMEKGKIDEADLKNLWMDREKCRTGWSEESAMEEDGWPDGYHYERNYTDEELETLDLLDICGPEDDILELVMARNEERKSRKNQKADPVIVRSDRINQDTQTEPMEIEINDEQKSDLRMFCKGEDQGSEEYRVRLKSLQSNLTRLAEQCESIQKGSYPVLQELAPQQYGADSYRPRTDEVMKKLQRILEEFLTKCEGMLYELSIHQTYHRSMMHKIDEKTTSGAYVTESLIDDKAVKSELLNPTEKGDYDLSESVKLSKKQGSPDLSVPDIPTTGCETLQEFQSRFRAENQYEDVLDLIEISEEEICPKSPRQNFPDTSASGCDIDINQHQSESGAQPLSELTAKNTAKMIIKKNIIIQPATSYKIKVKLTSEHNADRGRLFWMDAGMILDADLNDTDVIRPPQIHRLNKIVRIAVRNYTTEPIKLRKGTCLGDMFFVYEEEVSEMIEENEGTEKSRRADESQIAEEKLGDGDWDNQRTFWKILHHRNMMDEICTNLNDDEIEERCEELLKKYPWMNLFNWDDDLESRHRLSVYLLAEQHQEAFSRTEFEIGRMKDVLFEINMIHDKPINTRPYPMTPDQMQIFQKLVDKMVKQGVIVESVSRYNSPVVLVGKSDGSARPCLDYRNVNKAMKPNYTPLQSTQYYLDKLKNKTIFSSLDISSAYMQVAIRPEDRHITAFTCGNKKYEFKGAPYGLTTSGHIFNREMYKTFIDQDATAIFNFVDDIVTATTTIEENIANLAIIFEKLEGRGLKLQPKKCYFLKREILFLGHVASAEGLRPNIGKIAPLFQAQKPMKKKELRSFMGSIQFWARYVPGLHMTAAPLTELLKDVQPFKWTEEHDRAYISLLKQLATTPILTSFETNKRLIIMCDASKLGAAAVCIQLDDDKKPHLIATISRKWKNSESLKHIYELELYAVRFCIKEWKSYIQGSKGTVIYTDNSCIAALMNMKELQPMHGMVMRDVMHLDVTFSHLPTKRNVIADHLTRSFKIDNEVYEPAVIVVSNFPKIDVPEKAIEEWKAAVIRTLKLEKMVKVSQTWKDAKKLVNDERLHNTDGISKTPITDEEYDPLQIASDVGRIDGILEMNPATDSLYMQASKILCGDVRYAPILRFLNAELISKNFKLFCDDSEESSRRLVADIKHARKYHEKELSALATLLMIPISLPNKENLPIYFTAKASNLHRWSAYGMVVELTEGEDGSFEWTNMSLTKETFDEFNTEKVCRGAATISQKKLQRTFEPKSKGIPDFIDISLDDEKEELSEDLIKELRRIMENPIYTAVESKYKPIDPTTSEERVPIRPVEKVRAESVTLASLKSDKKMMKRIEEIIKDHMKTYEVCKYAAVEETSPEDQASESQTEKEGTEDLTLSNPMSEETEKEGKSVKQRGRRIKVAKKIPFPCPTCGKNAKNYAINCSRCELWVHNKCSGIESDITDLNEQQQNEYICQECKKVLKGEKVQETEEADDYETAPEVIPETPEDDQPVENVENERTYDHLDEMPTREELAGLAFDNLPQGLMPEEMLGRAEHTERNEVTAEESQTASRTHNTRKAAEEVDERGRLPAMQPRVNPRDSTLPKPKHPTPEIITHSTMIEAQKKDALCKLAYLALMKPQELAVYLGEKQRKQIIKFAEQLTMSIEGIVITLTPPKNRNYLEEITVRTLLPLALIPDVIQIYHTKFSHFGQKRTVEEIAKRFIRPASLGVPSLAIIAKEYVTNCDFCARKSTQKNQKVPVAKNRQPTGRMEALALDFFGPLPKSDEYQWILDKADKTDKMMPTGRSFTYILSIVDLFSGLVWLFPCMTQTAWNAKTALLQVVSVHGVVDWIRTDNAQQFNAHIFKDFCRLMQIKIVNSLSYHPESNGKVERNMRILGDIFRTSGVTQNTWHSYLPMVQLAMNNAFNRNMNDSAFFVHYGFDPKLPYDMVSPRPILMNETLIGSDSIHESGVILQQTLLQIRDHLIKCMDIASTKDQSVQNKKRKQRVLQPGDRAMVWLPLKESQSKKFHSHWYGPLRILGQLDRMTILATGGNNKEYRCHMDRVKKIPSDFKEKMHHWSEIIKEAVGFERANLTPDDRAELIRQGKEIRKDLPRPIDSDQLLMDEENESEPEVEAENEMEDPLPGTSGLGSAKNRYMDQVQNQIDGIRRLLQENISKSKIKRQEYEATC